MPGIVGLITKKKRQQAEAQLQQMVQELKHETFYESGTWIDETSGVYVGWIARGGAAFGQLPIQNARGDKALVFSGEEYSDPDKQDKSYLIELADGGNSAFPGCLNGRFQGLMVDKAAGMSTLFNDRYGMHRVYYYESQDTFYFAAEAKAILKVCPELRVIDPRGMGELVSCGCVLENRTVFKDIHVLPPASAWVFKKGAIERKSSYFNPKEWENQEPLELEQYYQRLRGVFSENISKYFGGHHSIGVSLTGGLDSRMIMAWLKAAPGSIPCYSFGGMFHDCLDVTLARRVAELSGQQHQTIPVGDDFLTRFGHYSERTVFLSDACVDVSHTADLYINEIARQIAPVRMTGNYGGEVLRSIRAFKPVEPPSGLFQTEFSGYLGQAKETYASLISVHPLSFSVFRQAPWHHYGLQALEQTQLALRSPYLDNEFVKTVFRAPKSTLSSNDISLRLIRDGNADLLTVPTDRGLAGKSGLLAAALRHQYQEFTFKAEYAYDYGMPQWLARTDHALSKFHLERLFLGRHKFYHYRVWYRDALADYVRQILLDSRTLSRPYLQSQSVKKMVESHLNGRGNYTLEIHKLLTLEHLHRQFIEVR